MNAVRIKTYEGSTDGIRYGVAMIGVVARRFYWDRLNGTLHLSRLRDGWEDVDEDPIRTALILNALQGRP